MADVKKPRREEQIDVRRGKARLSKPGRTMLRTINENVYNQRDNPDRRMIEIDWSVIKANYIWDPRVYTYSIPKAGEIQDNIRTFLGCPLQLQDNDITIEEYVNVVEDICLDIEDIKGYKEFCEGITDVIVVMTDEVHLDGTVWRKTSNVVGPFALWGEPYNNLKGRYLWKYIKDVLSVTPDLERHMIYQWLRINTGLRKRRSFKPVEGEYYRKWKVLARMIFCAMQEKGMEFRGRKLQDEDYLYFEPGILKYMENKELIIRLLMKPLLDPKVPRYAMLYKQFLFKEEYYLIQ